MYDISKEKQTPEGGQQKMAHDPCSRIQALYPRLSKVEAKIADYILRDPLRVTELSVQAMAQEIGVAQSSIVRFCRTIECSGLRELKLQLASHENAFVIPTIFEDLSPEDDAQSIATKVFTRNVNTIQRTLQALDFAKIETAVALLGAAKRIYVYGLGASASLADDFYIRLMRIGINASAVTDSHLCQISSGLMQEGDVLVGISHTGRTADILRAMQVARGGGAKTIGITGYAQMPIREVSDVCLELYSPEQLFVSPRVAQVSLLDSLYVCLGIRQKDRVMRCVQRMEEVLRPMRVKL